MSKKPKKAWEDSSVVLKMRALHKTHYIFIGNYRDLKAALESLKQPQVSIEIGIDEAKFEMLSLHIIRLLHNHLSASYSLRDHTYELRKVYKDTDFEVEYDAKVKETFGNSLLIQFMQVFRNYILHEGLPLVSTSTNLGSLQSFVYLEVSHLLGSKYFTGKSKQYLETLGERARLDEIIEEHTQIVIGFYDWFYQRQNELHFDR